MRNLKKIEEEIDRLGDLRALTETYETVAASSMQRIRNIVVQNRIFHAGLNDVFQEVRHAYERSLHAYHGMRQSVLPSKKRKEVLVFLSANTGLYGDLIEKIAAFFEKEMQHFTGDVVVVGKLGARIMDERFPAITYRAFDLSDQEADSQEIRALIEYVRQYEKVCLLHGSFKNILRQDPTLSSPLGSAAREEVSAHDHPRYLFEPTLNAVAVFFETEIFASFLTQVLSESRLAKLASRLVVLDRATQNIDRVLKKNSMQKKQLSHWLANKKQINISAGAITSEHRRRKNL